MHLLLLSEPTYPEHAGGAGKCAYRTASVLTEAGHHVDLVCGTGSEFRRVRTGGLTVHRVPLPRRPCAAHRRETVTARTFIAYCEQELALGTVDLVHDYGGFLSYFHPVAAHLVTVKRLPFVLHFQFLNWAYQCACDPEYQPLSRPHLELERGVQERIQCYAVRLADRVVCPSFAEAAFVERLFRPQAGRLQVIPNPVTIGPAAPRTATHRKPGVRCTQGLSRILFGGRIDSPMKGADIVFDAFREIRKRRPGCRLLLLSGSEAWRRRHADLASGVTQLGWIADDDAVRQVLATVDAVLMPSHYEPFGMMCAEALAAGVPVVASPVGGLREMIRPGENGFLLRAGAVANWPAELADYVLRILELPRLAARLRAGARQFAKRHLSEARVVGQLEALYRELLSPTGPADARGFHAPTFGSEEERLYRHGLRAAGGARAEAAALAALAGWRRDVGRFCRDCTRGRLASDALALLGAGARAAQGGPGSARARGDLERACGALCPLGLVQRWTLQTHCRQHSARRLAEAPSRGSA